MKKLKALCLLAKYLSPATTHQTKSAALNSTNTTSLKDNTYHPNTNTIIKRLKQMNV
ncbi:MAG: hypothetical protein JO149_01555 [Gammaproteobacteria bacterium]|nr:hypothetical protein [Gammaproteobacteria bacterium]